MIVPAPIRIATVDPTRTRLRSSERSSRGTATRPSTAMNAYPAAIETAKQPRVPAENHPQSLLSVTARMRGISVTAISAVPA